MGAIARTTITWLKNKLAYTLWASCFFLLMLMYITQTLTVGNSIEIMTTAKRAGIEIVTILFAIFFWATAIATEKKHKTLELLWSKKRNSTAIILGKSLWLITITLTLLWGLLLFCNIIVYILYNGNIGPLRGELAIIAIKSITIANIALLAGTICSEFIAFFITLCTYIIGHSINFILFTHSLQQQTDNIILWLIKVIMPNFDTLWLLVTPNITHMETLTIIFMFFLYNVIIVGIAMLTLHQQLCKKFTA